MANEIKRRWITGISPDGKTLYFNINAIGGVEPCDEDDFVLFLGGGERIVLKDCTFSNDYPDFVEVED
jgi:hypothetical protein